MIRGPQFFGGFCGGAAGGAAGGTAGGAAVGDDGTVAALGKVLRSLPTSFMSLCTFKLSRSFSTGIDGFAGVTGTGPVELNPGVRGTLSEPVNGTGFSRRGSAWPAGIARAISGVTITRSSLFCLLSDFD